MVQRALLLLCMIGLCLCFLRLLLVLVNELEEEQRTDHQYDTDRQRDEPALDKAGYDKADERYRGNGDRVRQLSRYVVDVVTLRTRRGHDGGVGNGRAVVAAYSARETGGDTDDLQLAVREDGQNDRNEDTEGAP